MNGSAVTDGGTVTGAGSRLRAADGATVAGARGRGQPARAATARCAGGGGDAGAGRGQDTALGVQENASPADTENRRRAQTSVVGDIPAWEQAATCCAHLSASRLSTERFRATRAALHERGALLSTARVRGRLCVPPVCSVRAFPPPPRRRRGVSWGRSQGGCRLQARAALLHGGKEAAVRFFSVFFAGWGERGGTGKDHCGGGRR